MIEKKVCGATKEGECWRVITNKELHDPREQRNHKICKTSLTHAERMQNQIMPKQFARATKEETRKREDQIKNGDKT
jgi:serine phosphatase RsbU (regulator of sigma subunit)